MKIAILTEPGLLDLLKKEIEEMGFKPQKKQFFLELEESPKQILKIMYLSGLATNIITLDSFAEFKNKEDLLKKIKINPLKEKIKIECQRQGKHDFNSQDITKEISKKIVGSDYKDYENKAIIFIQNQNFVAGIDLVGKDLSKREYNIFIHPTNIKPTIALAAYYLTSRKGAVLDPMSLSGVIPIEIALKKARLSNSFYSKKFELTKLIEDNYENLLEETDSKINKDLNVYSIDKNFKNLSNQKKNAKIAGVEKLIEFSKYSLRDIDLKHWKQKIEIVITKPIEPSKKISEKIALDFFETFQNQMKILKPKEIVFIMEKPQILEKTSFKPKQIIKTRQGQRELNLVKIK
ncbi:MAG: hypothetical protein ACMXX7_01385 [Candidatus Woesearchaeota archaeon]